MYRGFVFQRHESLELVVVAHTSKTTAVEAEASESEFEVSLLIEFQANQGHVVRSCLKQNKTTTKTPPRWKLSFFLIEH